MGQRGTVPPEKKTPSRPEGKEGVACSLNRSCCQETDSRYETDFPLIHERPVVYPRWFLAQCVYNDEYWNARARFPFVVNRPVTTTSETTVAPYRECLRRSSLGNLTPRVETPRLPTPPTAVSSPPHDTPLP